MSIIRVFEEWAEGLLRIAIGAGLAWIGVAEAGGYGLFIGIVGAIFVVAGLMEIWSVEAAARRDKANTAGRGEVVCDIPVFYATSHGQTRRIAEHLAALFRDKGFSSGAFDVAGHEAARVDWARVQAAVVAASLHANTHQRSAASFAQRHATELNRRPSVFLSVSLAAVSEAAAERDEAARMAHAFVDAAAWRASTVVCLAGRLAYTQYGWLTRFVMKRIARRHGQPTDTTRDYEFTNWNEVAAVAEHVVTELAAQPRPRAA